ELLAVYAKLDEASKELTRAQKELIKSQSELMKYTTGGDSYGEVSILRINNGKDGYTYLFVLNNRGKYPLHDVKVMATNRKMLMAEDLKAQGYEITIEQFKKTVSSFDLGSIPAHGNLSFGLTFTLNENTMQDFLF